MTSRSPRPTCYHAGVRWVVLVLLLVGVASAAPTVEIRARTQLGLGRVKIVDGGRVEVTGYLSDKLTGLGIASERITITIGGQPVSVITGEDGSFTATVPSAPGTLEIQLAYKGGARLEPADPLTITTDPAKVEIELSLVKIADDPAGARIRVDAKSTESVETLGVQLSVAGINDDTWKPLREVESGKDFVFTRKEAGGAGLYRLRAQFVGDERRQAAESVVTIEMASGSVTSLQLSSTTVAYEDDIVATGKVTDDDGAPLEATAVTLMAGDRRLAQGTTNDGGVFRFEIEAEVVWTQDKPTSAGGMASSAAARGGDSQPAASATNGQYALQVQADPGFTYIKPSRSQPVVLRIAPPQPVPVSWTIAAFLATGLAAGAFFAARSKPWQRLRRAQPPADVPSEEGEIEIASGGLVTAKPGVVATLRRANDDGFAGVVRDTVRGRPVGDALVLVTLGDRERSIRTAADGSFAIEGLETGEWRAEVAAMGHVTERFAVTVPHRGELRGVRVDLVPVRERVFQLYRRAAEPVLPEARLWGIWSPRQIVDHVRAKRPSPALAELTDFVEEIYFSPRLAEEGVLETAEGRVSRALNERARTPR